MEFAKLLEIVGDEPVFETALLLAGETEPNRLRQQLTRWTQTGRLYQLRRGVYALAPPFQKIKPHPFLIANRVVRGSYVSLQTALAYYTLIPEYTPAVTSITPTRPAHFDTAFGRFEFQHVQRAWLRGYKYIQVSAGQFAYVATVEKALLDLIYLTPHAETDAYIDELRLQNLEQLDLNALDALANESQRPKLKRAGKHVRALAARMQEEFETL